MHKSILLLFLPLFLVACNHSKPVKPDIRTLETFIDNWHKAATRADLNDYFNAMSDSAMYLGTDPEERWTKLEFFGFCEPYFKKGKAWDFKPYNRKIYSSSDGNTIWFDELLKTWMGICRGSGVIIIENGEYKISHYHLSVTVRNSKIKDFIELKAN